MHCTATGMSLNNSNNYLNISDTFTISHVLTTMKISAINILYYLTTHLSYPRPSLVWSRHIERGHWQTDRSCSSLAPDSWQMQGRVSCLESHAGTVHVPRGWHLSILGYWILARKTLKSHQMMKRVKQSTGNLMLSNAWYIYVPSERLLTGD